MSWSSFGLQVPPAASSTLPLICCTNSTPTSFNRTQFTLIAQVSAALWREMRTRSVQCLWLVPQKYKDSPIQQRCVDRRRSCRKGGDTVVQASPALPPFPRFPPSPPAQVTVEVEAKRASAVEARQHAAEVTASVRHALAALDGLEERQVTTSQLRLSPQYRWLQETSEQQLTGYSCSQTLTIRR